MRFPWLSWLALACGVVLAVLAGLWTQGEVEREARVHFTESAREVAETVKKRFRAYEEVSYAVRALFDASGYVDRDGFRRFAQGLAIDERYPGITNVSYAFRVSGEQAAAFVHRQNAEGGRQLSGLPPFAISQAGSRAEYVALTYIEPLRPNAPALGLDLLGDPVRGAAVRNARDRGTTTTTSGLTLMRDRGTRATSVLLRIANYEGGGVPDTIDARRRAFTGVGGTTVHLPDFFAAALSTEARQHLRIRLEDSTAAPAAGDGVTESQMLFDSAVDGPSTPVAFAQYAASQDFIVGDRTWTLTATPLADPALRAPRWAPYAAAAAVLLLTLLFFGLLRALAAAEVRSVSLQRTLRTLEIQRVRLAETQVMANIGGYEWDTRDRRQRWSDQLYRILGREVGDPPEPGPDFFFGTVVHRDEIPAARAAVARVLEDCGPVTLQCRIVRPDGSERIVTTIAQLEDADDGARTRIVGTVRDITDEWRARERERAHLRFIQTMMDSIPIPVFQKNPAGRFQACNDAWCRFLGKSRDTILGRTIGEILPGDHVDAIRAQDGRLLTGVGTESIDTELMNAKGELRHVVLHKASYAAEDGAIEGLVGVAFDVTEMRATKDRLERTVTELDRRTRLAELLAEFGESLQACVGLDDAYETIAKFLPRLVPRSVGTLYRMESGSRGGVRCGGWGPPEAFVDALAASDCVAIRRGHPRCVADSAKQLNCRHFAETPPSYACLPLSSQGELLGLLHVQYPHPDEAGCDAASSWPALKSVAEHVSLAFANLTVREVLRERATHDKLTGLYNRHYLNARLEQEVARARRTRSPVAVIMLDIDHFKRFNDDFGHAAGDYVLHELGEVLRHAARQSDTACRYGGEEFVLLMPDTACDVATRRAEDIRVAVRNLRLEWEGQRLGTVTVSIGIAMLPEHGADPEAILRAADVALYRAKELGRDRVVVAALEPAVTRC
ncbi:Response regulator PleD [Burkholderiales bacterium]|nr:Response regulator PleD [Burkholderiales bacterium]